MTELAGSDAFSERRTANPGIRRIVDQLDRVPPDMAAPQAVELAKHLVRETMDGMQAMDFEMLATALQERLAAVDELMAQEPDSPIYPQTHALLLSIIAQMITAADVTREQLMIVLESAPVRNPYAPPPIASLVQS